MSRPIPNTPGIYRLSLGRRYYYGSAVNLQKRKSAHLNALARGKHANQILQRTYDKYGKSAFKFVVVEKVAHRSELLEREQVWLNKYHGRPLCANIARNAGCPVSGPRSTETKARISGSHKERGVHPPRHAVERSVLTRQRAVCIRFNSLIGAAKALGLSKQALQNYLRGRRGWPVGLTGHYA